MELHSLEWVYCSMHIARHHAVSCVLLPNKLIPALPPQVNIHSSLKNSNIVKFYGAYNDKPNDNSYAIVMEYAEKGCLFDYLKQHPGGDFALSRQTLQWAEHIALGLLYLHNEKCVIHMDLKSLNGSCVYAHCAWCVCGAWCVCDAWCVCVMHGVRV